MYLWIFMGISGLLCGWGIVGGLSGFIGWHPHSFLNNKNNALPINIGAADVDLDGVVTIGDVTSIIDYLLRGHW